MNKLKLVWKIWKKEIIKKLWWIPALIVIGILIGVGYFIFRPDSVYQYVDIHGNRGVGKDCYRENGIAYCEEMYGNNIIKVESYGRIK